MYIIKYISMVVSMIQIIFEIPDIDNIKEKRRVIKSVTEKMRRKFRMSAAEIDLQDSLTFAQIGGALVSNSRTHGETVLRKAFDMIEKETPVRIQDMSIHSEEF
ncbi:MAG: DUF503 domain-containing protein [Treponema sp.]|nr:DUF503 domain-containing protein [Treponema sp.]